MRANYLPILACIAASLWAWQQPLAFAESNLVFSSTNFLHGRPWTLLPALFVHASPLRVGELVDPLRHGSSVLNVLVAAAVGESPDSLFGHLQLLRDGALALTGLEPLAVPGRRRPAFSIKDASGPGQRLAINQQR